MLMKVVGTFPVSWVCGAKAPRGIKGTKRTGTNSLKVQTETNGHRKHFNIKVQAETEGTFDSCRLNRLCVKQTLKSCYSS